MGKTKNLLKVATVIAIMMLLLPAQAFAYLDPGTGSYVIQLLIGAVLGGAFAIKAFWKNIRSFISGITKSKKG